MIFGQILSRVETWVYKRHISSYFSDALAPLTGWPLGQQAGQPGPGGHTTLS